MSNQCISTRHDFSYIIPFSSPKKKNRKKFLILRIFLFYIMLRDILIDKELTDGGLLQLTAKLSWREDYISSGYTLVLALLTLVFRGEVSLFFQACFPFPLPFYRKVQI